MSHIKTIAILCLLLFIGVPAASVAYADAGTVQTVENESITVTTDTWTDVDHGESPYLDNETVYYNDSTVPESNYEWNTSAGTIQATGGDLANDSPADAEISYQYRASSGWTNAGGKVFVVVFTVFAGLLLFIGGMFVVNAMGSYRSGGGR